MTRIVLLALADMAKDDGLSWPSVAYLATKCRVCRRTIQSQVRKLISLGEVRIEKRGGIFGGRRHGNSYRVVCVNRSLALKFMPYKKYLETPEWKAKRERKLIDAGFRCQLCNESGELNVHHRTYKDRGNEDLRDLIVLCRGCHKKFHGIEPEATP
jgi:hypothetical protein